VYSGAALEWERNLNVCRARRLISASACLAALAGCYSADSLGPVTAEEQQALIQAAKSSSPNLQPGEKIKVTVFGEDRLTGEYQIDPAGFVSLPLAGTVRAGGLSKQEFEQALAKKFRSEYLRDPKVTVDVADFRPFYILGEVAKPGEYPFKGGMDVLSAIALAGGATYRASRSDVLIKHASESQFRQYPLSPSIPILPGDLIRVPERYF
jgi:polysaccharide export outer membrane protein